MQKDKFKVGDNVKTENGCMGTVREIYRPEERTIKTDRPLYLVNFGNAGNFRMDEDELKLDAKRSAEANMDIDFTPLNIKAFLYNYFGFCACADTEEVITEIKKFLEWLSAGDNRQNYQELFSGNIGVFYIISGIFDKLEMSEHGTSFRGAFITPFGGALLEALKTFSAEEIDNANGSAYNGCVFGNE